MALFGEILFWSVFAGSVSLIAFSITFSSLFFKLLNYVVDKSEGDATSDW